MISFLQAVSLVAEGHEVVSTFGKIYTKHELQPSWFGKHFASTKECGMTKEERERGFELVR